MNAQIPRDRTQVGTSPPAVSQFADGTPDAVRLDGVAKAFGSFVAVRDVNLPLAIRDYQGHTDLGVYAEVVEGGRIAPGDPIAFLD